MKNLNQHPYATMADFVNKYRYIKPFLEKEDLETANVGIGDVLWRYDKCIETNGDLITCLKANIQAVLRYKNSVNLLEGFYDKTFKKMNNLALLMINRDVAELDFILSEDEIYEKFRQREVFA